MHLFCFSRKSTAYINSVLVSQSQASQTSCSEKPLKKCKVLKDNDWLR